MKVVSSVLEVKLVFTYQIGSFLKVTWKFQMLATGDLSLTKLSVDCRCFRVFGFFYHRSYSKTRKSPNVLVCYFSKEWTLFELLTKVFKLFSVIGREVSKYCSKLSMQTENWILKQLCSFAMANSIDVPSCLFLSSC